MDNSNSMERLYNGLIKENPTFVLMLGMCPTLAVTTSAMNGLGMGLTTMVVLALSNMIISMLRNIIPDKVRIPAFIVVIASFVTMVELLLEGFIPALYDALGLYSFDRCKLYYFRKGGSVCFQKPDYSFSVRRHRHGTRLFFALTCIGAVRELIGAGEIFGLHIMPDSYVPCAIFIMAPGAFFVLAALTAVQNKIRINGERKGKDMSKIQSGCSEDCMNCGEKGCSHRFYGEGKESEQK